MPRACVKAWWRSSYHKLGALPAQDMRQQVDGFTVKIQRRGAVALCSWVIKGTSLTANRTFVQAPKPPFIA